MATYGITNAPEGRKHLQAFTILSILAILSGGLLSAFSARHPTRYTSWLSAYLVLISGVVQYGLVALWERLAVPHSALVVMALIIYNIGNGAVMLGTAMQPQNRRLLVNCGGVLLALSMALLLSNVWGSARSWNLAGFITLVVIVLISMPVGLLLSARRRASVS